MISHVNTKLDQWVSSHTGFFGIKKLISKKKIVCEIHFITDKK
jgi:hypothetical protein